MAELTMHSVNTTTNSRRVRLLIRNDTPVLQDARRVTRILTTFYSFVYRTHQLQNAPRPIPQTRGVSFERRSRLQLNRLRLGNDPSCIVTQVRDDDFERRVTEAADAQESRFRPLAEPKQSADRVLYAVLSTKGGWLVGFERPIKGTRSAASCQLQQGRNPEESRAVH